MLGQRCKAFFPLIECLTFRLSKYPVLVPSVIAKILGKRRKTRFFSSSFLFCFVRTSRTPPLESSCTWMPSFPSTDTWTTIEDQFFLSSSFLFLKKRYSQVGRISRCPNYPSSTRRDIACLHVPRRVSGHPPHPSPNEGQIFPYHVVEEHVGKSRSKKEVENWYSELCLSIRSVWQSILIRVCGSERLENLRLSLSP